MMRKRRVDDCCIIGRWRSQLKGNVRGENMVCVCMLVILAHLEEGEINMLRYQQSMPRQENNGTVSRIRAVQAADH